MAGSGAVTSCMDLSDGLGTALNTICEASEVGMNIDFDFIPHDPCTDEASRISGVPLEDILLGWGGEYELLFTADKAKLNRLYDLDVDFQIIGMVNDSGVPDLIRDGRRRRIEYGSYRP